MPGELKDYIQFDDLSRELQDLIHTIGIESVIKIIEEQHGSNFYVPAMKNIRPTLIRYLKDGRLNDNLYQLSKKTNATQAHLSNLISKIKKGEL